MADPTKQPGAATEEKRRALFLSQKHTLDLFLERGAISRAQYEKSLYDLVRLMGMEAVLAECDLPPVGR